MLCCIGLFVGFIVGKSFGGIWTAIMPIIGFSLGLLIDRKLIHKIQKQKPDKFCKEHQKKDKGYCH